MTRYLLDVASYQGDLKIEDCIVAGFSVVNLKVSHGLTQRSVHPNIKDWIWKAGAAGLDISTFHFLTGDASGVEQAAYVYRRLEALGVEGERHIVDVENNPVGPNATETIVAGYIASMQALLKRPVMVYTGDHFWKPRGWDVSDLTPYLHAAPNAGYLGSYPGDESPHWHAGYGGWPRLAVMQYAVQTIPGSGTIKVSKSAIRDEAVWMALKGGEPVANWILVEAGKSLFSAFNTIAPNRSKTSDGSIGDTAHQNSVSDHNPDETGAVPIHDADSTNEVHAIDVDKDLNESDITMEKVVQFLLSRCRSGAEKRLRYIIFNRRIWSASSDWVTKTYTGSSPHTEHAHFSFSYVSSLEASTAPWKLEEIPVALTAADKEWLTDTIETLAQKAVDKRVGDVIPYVDENGVQVPSTDPNPTVSAPTMLFWLHRFAWQINNKVDQLVARGNAQS